MANWIVRITNGIADLITRVKGLDATYDALIVQADAVYVDSVFGSAGTAWPIGQPQTPVDNIEDAVLIATARNLRTIKLVNPDDTFVLSADLEVFEVIGSVRDKAMAGINPNNVWIDRSIFRNVVINGQAKLDTGTTFIDCEINIDMTGKGFFYNCKIFDVALTSGADGYFYDCFSDEDTLAIIAASPGGYFHFTGFKGYLLTRTITNTANTIYCNGAQIEVDATCTGGTISIYGDAVVYDYGTAAGCTVWDYATYERGKSVITATTIDLNQVAASYDLFQVALQDVVLESLVIRMPNIVAGGALTNISIQTDDATPQVIISAADGAVGNLTAEAQLSWTGAMLLDAGTGVKIQLTIAGGAHGVAYVCDVVAIHRAVGSAGRLN